MSMLSPLLVGRLRLKHLELFRHVVEQQTLRGASELTHMTQPAATKLIQELEEIVGAVLFTRGRTGVRLTHEGEVLDRHVRVLLADLGHMAHEVRIVQEGGQGHIRLGVLPSLAPGLLTRVLALSLQSHPGLTFSIHEGSTKELLAALERNELDLAFARVLDQAQAQRFSFTTIYTEPFAVVVERGHALASVVHRDLWWSLSAARWVLPGHGTPLRETIDGLFSKHKQLRPMASVECHVLEKVAELVAHCGLVGVLPRSLATHGDHARSFHLLVDGILLGTTSLVARSHVAPTPVLREFVQQVRQAAADLKLSPDAPAPPRRSPRSKPARP